MIVYIVSLSDCKMNMVLWWYDDDDTKMVNKYGTILYSRKFWTFNTTCKNILKVDSQQ